jgi:hypothetical protein
MHEQHDVMDALHPSTARDQCIVVHSACDRAREGACMEHACLHAAPFGGDLRAKEGESQQRAQCPKSAALIARPHIACGPD